MTDKEILNRLWEAHRETPFASFVLQRKLNLRHDALLRVLNLLGDMADSEETQNGYRIKRVASTVYKMTQAPQGKSDTAKGKLLPDENETLTGESESEMPSADGKNGKNEPLELFSFFARGDQSKESKHTGNIEQLHRKLTTDPGWKHKIENLQSLTGEEQAKAKARLPAFTPSVCLSSGERTGEFVHTNLVQADFDEAPDFSQLFQDLCKDPHTRLVFRSPRGKVKALIKVATVATGDDHAAAFEAVRRYCQDQGYGEIDGKPKNINCLCFISYDPKAVLKSALPLSWEPMPQQNTAQSLPTSDYDGEPAELTVWLRAHRVIIRDTRNHEGNLVYFVDCPWENEHTQDFGHKDTAVFVDPIDGKWCFNCFHAHCNHRGWKEFRAKVAPRGTDTPPRKSISKSKRRLYRDQQLYGRKR